MLNEACFRGIPCLHNYTPNPTKHVTPNRPLQHPKNDITPWYPINDRWGVRCFNRVWRETRFGSLGGRIAAPRTFPTAVLSNSEFDKKKLAWRNSCLFCEKLSPETMTGETSMAAISALTELRPHHTRIPYTSARLENYIKKTTHRHSTRTDQRRGVTWPHS